MRRVLLITAVVIGVLVGLAYCAHPAEKDGIFRGLIDKGIS